MPIYAAPSELRQRTRLPDALARQSRVLPGLEAVTGADLLITVSGNALEDVRGLKDFDVSTLGVGSPQAIARAAGVTLPIALLALRFKAVCDRGTLAQRKTGRDLASSVPHLSRVLEKMLRWTSEPWLLPVGILTYDREGKAVIDGQRTGFSYEAVCGALRAWQRRGGYIEWRATDNSVVRWVSLELDRLRAPQPDKMLPVRGVQQPIVGPQSEKPWKATLASFPGCETVLANRLAERPNSLATCLESMTDPRWLRPKWERPQGVGVGKVRAWREWLGLEDDWLQLAAVAVPPEKGEK